MAIFRLPPGPFTGGRQPYDNKDLNPQGVQVDNPPFRRNPALLVAIILAWQPLPLQPQRTPQTPQETEQPAAVNIHVRSQIYNYWIIPPYDPIVNKKLPSSILAVPEDTVLSIKNLNPILQHWHHVIPRFVTNEKLVHLFEEHDIFNISQINIILESWKTPDYFNYVKKLNPSLLAVNEDFVFPTKINLNIIRSNWNITPPQIVNRNLTFLSEVINDPPFGTRPWLSTIITANQLQEWGSQHKNLYPSLLDVIVNNPPFGQRYWMYNIRDRWEPGPPMPYRPSSQFSPPVSGDIIIWIWRRIL